MTTPLPTTAELRSLLACWLEGAVLADCQIHEVTGGLSGARIWQVIVGDQKLCLRRWPTVHPSPEKLTAIHHLIEHVDRRGLNVVPVPQRTREGDSIRLEQNHLWELTPWLPGAAIAPSDVTPEVLGTAGATLARFHLAAADYSTDDQKPGQGPAPGLKKRQQLLESLRDGQLQLLRRYVASECHHPQHQFASNMLDSIAVALEGTLQSVGAVSAQTFPLQWCLGDVHREHLLFTKGEVTGLIDFGAATVGSVAGDVARLGGSLCGDTISKWSAFLLSYETLRPLSVKEREAVAAYDAGGLIGAAANWIRWLLVEHKDFGDFQAREARLSALESRLKQLAQAGGASTAARAIGTL